MPMYCLPNFLATLSSVCCFTANMAMPVSGWSTVKTYAVDMILEIESVSARNYYKPKTHPSCRAITLAAEYIAQHSLMLISGNPRTLSSIRRHIFKYNSQGNVG